MDDFKLNRLPLGTHWWRSKYFKMRVLNPKSSFEEPWRSEFPQRIRVLEKERRQKRGSTSTCTGEKSAECWSVFQEIYMLHEHAHCQQVLWMVSQVGL